MMRYASVGALGISVAMHAAFFLVPGERSLPQGDAIEAPELTIEAFEAPPRPNPVAPKAPTTDPVMSPLPEHVAKSDLRVTSKAPTLAAQPSPASTSNDAMPHFTIAIGASPNAYGGVAPAASAPVAIDSPSAPPVPESQVDGKARLVFGVSPSYPDSARENGVEGDVRLELVVGPTGAVESARVVRSVDPSLDDAALRAVQKFRFDPASRSGHPVRVRMGWSIQFRLR